MGCRSLWLRTLHSISSWRTISTVLILLVMLMDVLRELEAADISVAITAQPRLDADTRADAFLDIEVDNRRVRFVVEEKRRAPYPGELKLLAQIRQRLSHQGTPLLIAPLIPESTGRQLTRAGWSWADAAGNFDLRSDGVRLRQRLPAKLSNRTPSRLPRGSGSWAIMRWLIGHAEVTTVTDLAKKTEVSQPRASQVLHQLEDLDLVGRADGSTWAADRDALLDRFLAEYPGPGGSERYLFSLDHPIELLRRLATGPYGRPKGDLAVSADAGPDLIMSWRRPTLVIFYTASTIRLEQLLALTPAHGPGDANVLQRVPEDRSVYPSELFTADLDGHEVPLADPVQMLWDLEDLGGEDRLQAAERLRAWLLNRH
jgi:hypothetical protein